LRAVLEPLFLESRVDMYLAAHLHAYERSYPVLDGALCKGQERLPRRLHRPCAPIYITNGDAGEPALRYHSPPAKWTARRRPGLAGYGELTLHNVTHLQYRQLEALTGGVRDEFWITKSDDFEDGPLRIPEEDFLEAVFWLGFAIFVITLTCGLIRWIHADGLKRRDEALRNLRIELSVLSGTMPAVLGTAQEAESLVEDTAGSGTRNGIGSSNGTERAEHASQPQP